MRKRLNYLLSILLFTLCFSLNLRSQVDLGFAYPKLWLRADSISEEITQNIWRDVSGYNHNAQIYDFQFENSFEDFNYNPSLNLLGTSYIEIDSLNLNLDNLTVMMVYQITDSINENNLWQLSLDSSGNHNIGMTTRRILDFYGASPFCEKNNVLPLVNTLTQGVSTSENDELTLVIGSKDTLPFVGKISEILVFTEMPHDSIIKIWETYLGIKYGITLNSRSYYNSVQDSIWNYYDNTNFSGQIIGIGKDKYFGLNQKQSKTSDNLLTIGFGEKADSNLENLAELDDLQFIIIGIDTIALKTRTELNLENGFILTTYGNFRVQKTGSQENATFLELNYSKFETDTSFLQNIHLLINRSSEDSLEVGSFDFYPPAYIDTANKVLVFKDIYWDTDINGSDLFCLALLTPDSILNYALLNEPDPNEDLVNYFESFYSNSISDELHNKLNDSLDENKNSDNLTNESTLGNNIESTVAIFPIPSYDGHFELEIQLAETSNITISLTNIEGKTLKTKRLKNISYYKASFFIKTKGEYQIKVETKAEQYVRKIIII